MDDTEIKYFIESALLAAGRPLTIQQLQDLFDGRSTPEKPRIRAAIAALEEDYEARGLTVAEVASGFRLQLKTSMAERLGKLWEERPPRYSRALFETLALIAYRQPITRGEIEEVRGVAVSSNIVRTLMERDWVRVVGHRDVPGRPAMFGTTRTFLDYFGLKKLDDLPPLADLADWESLRVQLNLPEVEEAGEASVAEGGVEAEEGVDIVAVEIEGSEAAANNDVGIEAPDEERPEAAEATSDDEPETPADDDAAGDDADDAATEDVDELVVSEWPDPQDPKAIATLETRDDDDRDASAGGG